MAKLELEGNTLGEKHRHYNKLVKEAIEKNEEFRNLDLISDEGDIERLLNIDVACKNKNVEYIIEALKSEDMLYVSKAIKRSTWLITDPRYSHIINPQYLYIELFPHMTTKAAIKFKKQIRLHLRDETRGVMFYNTEKDKKEAVKWLPICPLNFIEVEVREHSDIIKTRLFKRLCEKSVKVLEAALENKHCFNAHYSKKQRLEATKFLIRHNAEKYLDILEKEPLFEFPKFGVKTTDTIMKTCSERVKNKFELYWNVIHLPTFAKYIKPEEAKEFLFIQAKKERNFNSIFFNLKCLRYLINRIPESDRFEFVNQVFINKIHTEHDTDTNTEKFAMRKLYYRCRQTPTYKFYEFAPFEVAFQEIIKLIHSESCIDNKNAMLEVLVRHEGRSTINLQKLLEYYKRNHSNAPQAHKIAFTTKIISVTDFHRFNDTTWNILNDIYKDLNVYVDSKDKQKFSLAIDSIIVYEVIRNKKPSEIIEKHFDFNTFKIFQKRLNENEKDKILNYLYTYKCSQIQNINIKTEAEFKSVIDSLNEMLNLLIDWNKDIFDYQWVLQKIKELVQMKKNEHFDVNISSIYIKNKAWKRYMFDDSLGLHPSPAVCINILKHAPHLLTVNDNIVQELCRDDRVSLQAFLKKQRIYWSESLASKTINCYLERFAELGGHKALIRGLCALLSRNQLNEIIQKYVPKQDTIDWGTIDELELSLQRHIAKNMHFGRPQPYADAILCYTKGDYLQYALPSLLSIFYNLNAICTREHIPKLLDAPVSVQKHGIRLAYNKLPSDELHQLFADRWIKTKNNTIRSITFKYTFDLLIKEMDSSNIKKIWQSLATFMDSLTYEEDKNIYKLLTKVEKVPMEVRPDFLMKSYEFLKRLIPNLSDLDKDQYKQILEHLKEHVRDLVEYLPGEFVESIIGEYINVKYFNSETSTYDETMKILTAYVLCGNNETQLERFDKIVKPILQKSFTSWHKMEGNEYYIRKKCQTLLNTFRNDLKYVVNKHFNTPIELYLNIENELKKLPVPENYIMLTKWNLTVALAKILDKTNKDTWDNSCMKTCKEFSEVCLMRLKEDVEHYFPCIYLLFPKILEDILEDFKSDFKWQMYKHLTEDEKCIQAYLALVKAYPQYVPFDEKQNAQELRNILWAHPSVEVKMHCYHKFKNED